MVSPSGRTDELCRTLSRRDEISNLVVLPGAARKPTGDLVMCDVTRAAANEVIELLDRLDVESRGSVAAERVDLSLGRAASGDSHRDEAVVWEELQQRIDETSRLTWSYVAFLVIAVLIAAIGIIQDSPVLIVGAMVLGPEFGPVAAVCIAMMRRRPRRAIRAVRTLAVGFAAAIAAAFAVVTLFHLGGWIDPSVLGAASDETTFIVSPDRWSIMVALLAGVAGILSLTSDKSQALVGVFISVTTVPAASFAAIAAALGHWSEVGPSLGQLSLNLFGMSVAGLLTLILLLAIWGKAGLHIRMAHGHRRPHP